MMLNPTEEYNLLIADLFSVVSEEEAGSPLGQTLIRFYMDRFKRFVVSLNEKSVGRGDGPGDGPGAIY